MLELDVIDRINAAAEPYYVTLGEYEAARHQLYFCFDRNWDEIIDTHPPGTDSWFVINEDGNSLNVRMATGIAEIFSSSVPLIGPLDINVNRARGWYVPLIDGERLPTAADGGWWVEKTKEFDPGMAGTAFRDIPRDTLVGIRGPMIKIEDAFRIGVFDVTPSPPRPPRPVRPRRPQRRQRR